MNWIDLICFVPLAVLCNTVLPVPFDPVLIFFASRQSTGHAVAFALLGSLCAGVAAAVDVTVLRRFHGRTPKNWLGLLPQWKGKQVYVLTFLFALLPLPFSFVRLAVLRHPPRLIPYQVSVALGRLPRYLLTIVLWPKFGLPRSAGIVLLMAAAFVGVIRLYKIRGRSTAKQLDSY